MEINNKTITEDDYNEMIQKIVGHKMVNVNTLFDINDARKLISYGFSVGLVGHPEAKISVNRGSLEIYDGLLRFKSGVVSGPGFRQDENDIPEIKQAFTKSQSDPIFCLLDYFGADIYLRPKPHSNPNTVPLILVPKTTDNGDWKYWYRVEIVATNGKTVSTEIMQLRFDDKPDTSLFRIGTGFRKEIESIFRQWAAPEEEMSHLIVDFAKESLVYRGSDKSKIEWHENKA